MAKHREIVDAADGLLDLRIAVGRYRDVFARWAHVPLIAHMTARLTEWEEKLRAVSAVVEQMVAHPRTPAVA